MASPAITSTNPPVERERFLRRLARILWITTFVYVVLTYVVVPAGWSHYSRRHPKFEDVPGITHTRVGIPGDPINVALVGSRADMERVMQAAGWYGADPITLRSSWRIAADTVLKRSYDEAPVSPLYLWGRKEDMAFQQPVGDNPRQRHHVRFWQAPRNYQDDRPVWVGSATFDERVGFSHTTGQVTHHISGDVDAERDHLFATLEKTGQMEEVYMVPDFHKICQGRNGGGDRWHTDGDLEAGIIRPQPAVKPAP